MVQLRVDARPLLVPDAAGPNTPGLRPQSLTVGLDFTTPFPLFRWLRGSDDDDSSKENTDTQEQTEDVDEDVALEITAAIGGSFKRATQQITFTHPVTQEETRTVSPRESQSFASAFLTFAGTAASDTCGEQRFAGRLHTAYHQWLRPEQWHAE